MSLEVSKSTDFKIREIVLATKAGNIDITPIFEELNIFDSIFSPVMTGSIMIRDTLGLSGRLLFDGSESIMLDILKDEKTEVLNFKKAFRIYKQSKRISESTMNELYILNFCSDELLYSDQQRINQSYEMTYSEIVEKIAFNYLQIPKNQLGGVYDKTMGIRKVIIPNLRPLEAIEWCAKRAVDENNSPNFIFFQNVTGYNFASLSTLISHSEIIDVNYYPKNMKNQNAIKELSGARSVEIVSQVDASAKIRSGVNAGKFIGFDPITRITAIKNITYGNHYDTLKHENDNPNLSIIKNRQGIENTKMFDSKKVMSVFSSDQQLSEYIKSREPESLSKINDTENYIFQRKAIFSNLMEKRVKIVMPGNFQLSSGFKINLIAPLIGTKLEGDANEDVGLSGKYLIVGARHIITYSKHETVFEAATTSTENSFVPVSSDQQIQQILEY